MAFSFPRKSKIRRQDFSSLLFYYLGYSRIRNLLFRLGHKPITRIVTFHDIPPGEFRQFKANLCFLKLRTHVVGLPDYFAGRLSSKKINVIITFDDGFKSWIEAAAPLLKEWGLPATFFVSSGFIDLPKDQEADFLESRLFLSPRSAGPPRGLSSDDIRGLFGEGFCIGGHTVNHGNLARLRDRAQVRFEIEEDKRRLEQIIGNEIRYFAYPSGAFDNPEINLAEILQEAGYQGAVSTIPGFNDGRTDPYRLRRELTRAPMTEKVFRARVYGNYDLVRFIKKRARLNRH
jgi:peptidoglycan/xylan/chitin deacetylase (PgdA/CDA1 family)